MEIFVIIITGIVLYIKLNNIESDTETLRSELYDIKTVLNVDEHLDRTNEVI